MLLDDPTSSLDNQVTHKIMTSITQDPKWNQITYLITTNNATILKFVNRVFYMSEGVLAFDGTVEEFRKTSIFNDMIDSDSKLEAAKQK